MPDLSENSSLFLSPNQREIKPDLQPLYNQIYEQVKKQLLENGETMIRQILDSKIFQHRFDMVAQYNMQSP